MTAIDPFTTPADVDITLAARHASTAADRLELASDQMDEVANRQYGKAPDETLLRFAELNIQRARTGAVLAMSHEVSVLRQVLDDGMFALGDVLSPGPRWWQWRRRLAMRAIHHSLLNSAAVGLPALAEDSSTVREYLVEVRQADGEVLGCSRFHAEPHAACDMAATLLPGLCPALDAPADPDRVYGRVFLCEPGNELGRYINSVFMSGTTILPTLREEFS